jgi:hypothetical protein
LFTDLVFLVGIGGIFLVFYQPIPKENLVGTFWYQKLAGAPFSLQKGGLWTPFGALRPPCEGKRVSRGFFQRKLFQKLQNRVPAKSYSTKNTNRIYQPASVGTIPIPARRPVLGWYTTLQISNGIGVMGSAAVFLMK